MKEVKRGLAAPETLAFDMYGNLVDPIRICNQLEGYVSTLGDLAKRLAQNTY